MNHEALVQPLLPAIREHAALCAPKECCGLVIVRKGRARYLPCQNTAQGPEHFVIAETDYAAAEEQGEVILVVHSHLYEEPVPSQPDLIGIERSGLPWLIVNHPLGTHTITAPSGYTAPLEGRQFMHGVLDCYTLIRDYYREKLGIDLPDFEREDNWWEKGQNLYIEGFQKAGFQIVSQDDIRQHDVLLMMVRASVPNHGGVFLGDARLLHHQTGRLSSQDVYGGWLRQITSHVLRHKSLL